MGGVTGGFICPRGRCQGRQGPPLGSRAPSPNSAPFPSRDSLGGEKVQSGSPGDRPRLRLGHVPLATCLGPAWDTSALHGSRGLMRFPPPPLLRAPAALPWGHLQAEWPCNPLLPSPEFLLRASPLPGTPLSLDTPAHMCGGGWGGLPAAFFPEGPQTPVLEAAAGPGLGAGPAGVAGAGGDLTKASWTAWPRGHLGSSPRPFPRGGPSVDPSCSV